MTTTSDWVYSKAATGWDMSWAGFFGVLPKLTIVCGRCERRSRSRATRAVAGKVLVWCRCCGVANVVQGLTVEG
jgi:hypothetical protein